VLFTCFYDYGLVAIGVEVSAATNVGLVLVPVDGLAAAVNVPVPLPKRNRDCIAKSIRHGQIGFAISIESPQPR